MSVRLLEFQADLISHYLGGMYNRLSSSSSSSILEDSSTSSSEEEETRGTIERLRPARRRPSLPHLLYEKPASPNIIYKIVKAYCMVHHYHLATIYESCRRYSQRIRFMDETCTLLYVEIYYRDVRKMIKEMALKDLVNTSFGDSRLTVFLFEKGSVIFWSNEEEANIMLTQNDYTPVEHSLLKFFSNFSEKLRKSQHVQEDHLLYCQAADLPASFKIPKQHVKSNRIYLKTFSAREKLAISFALAQSVRLEVYEASVFAATQRIREIPHNMVKLGRKLYSHSLLMASCAVEDSELIREIVHVNLLEDFLDVPEYFWSNDAWQSLWERVGDFAKH
ncbi:ACR, YagE family COG1723 domain-containing protein [Cardiosporidium cionae]|uniref:ACR, YagE family COG1723 domain-containing protein n=1 Tax=Cardiosporidium cionae TaxID=476202 RepID=A0ABQ7JCX7_9APIC|nr:ACR, YagE family COG1723 domain-containing protein [Cardiosporidium cionae]|eukprot:KAF8821809.1 ACR, YagE family COG1723 domain-containing protein [Cardiosporidium cionae]